MPKFKLADLLVSAAHSIRRRGSHRSERHRHRARRGRRTPSAGDDHRRRHQASAPPAGVDLGQPVQLLLDERPAWAPKIRRRRPSAARRRCCWVDEPACAPPRSSSMLRDAWPDRRAQRLHQTLGLLCPRASGGFGTRLRPLTDASAETHAADGRSSAARVIVRQLHQAGIRHVSIARHYKGDQIEQHFGDGRRFSVDIE